MTTNDTSPAGLDLDAVTKRARRVYPKRGWDGGEAERALPVVTEDVPALVAEVRRLLTLRDDLADAFDGLVMKVWLAAGEEHEPPADVEALLARVEGLRAAALPAGHVAVDRVLYDAACRLASDVPRLQREVAAARREGAEAMREACAVTADDDAREAAVVVGRCADGTAERGEAVAWRQASEHLARAIRALPLPGGEP